MIHAMMAGQLLANHEGCDPECPATGDLRIREYKAYEAEREAVEELNRVGRFFCMGCLNEKHADRWMATNGFSGQYSERGYFFGAFSLCSVCANSDEKQMFAHEVAPTKARDAAEQGTWKQIC